jgi:hypothetical protein
LLFSEDGALSIGPGPLPPGTPMPDDGVLADGPGCPGAPLVAVLGGGEPPGAAAVPCAMAVLEPAANAATIKIARANMSLSPCCLGGRETNESASRQFLAGRGIATIIRKIASGR